MASPEDSKGGAPPGTEHPSAPADAEAKISYSPTTDASNSYSGALTTTEEPKLPAPAAGGSGSKPPPPPGDEQGGDEEDGMLRMSFLEHLEELRTRIIRALMGVGVAFAFSLFLAERLWLIVQAPAEQALRTLGYPPNLVITGPMEAFQIVWVKLPLLSAVFLAAPWILYQVWAFISPGLYKKERRWAVPFVMSSGGLFLIGGLFAYFIAFRYGLTFLLGIGQNYHITPMVTISEYFDLFVDVMLGIGLVFELPVLLFFLMLLRIVTPGFLINHSRYAILIIVIIAAVVTPTPDVFNMMLFATPMILLFYVGIFAGYLLNLSREGKKFPWKKVLRVAAVVLFIIAGAMYFVIAKYGYHWVGHWPFLTR